ncbi:hypothetical protein H5119_13090 [Pseudoalteromonas sp. SG45-5]|uniref:hypothetical protein n=1 Tax=unclassified Pseudoalteromonas TaxID=194690 RepID=UPI0015FC7BE2|nr:MULTISPECIES: hypothetical protein [unclassified Pseudoalteromonas]MBB1386463.1 hypothetical protein [Pseudoalteromonas sp. SG45-5]MBB1394503.1 hypothetical protein [Pseudoalteromonas sp. SG44-4]MBB1446915.1 hypothetical protein [Pseudoalteromonas sp. SG41-6]
MRKNKENNQRSILATQYLLMEIIKSPDEFKNNSHLVKALKSQGGLAKYENIERNIVACAINTVKSLSELLFDDGFTGFDRLRMNARVAIEKALTGKIKKSNEESARQKLASIAETLAITQQSNFLLNTVIKEMRANLKAMALQDGTDEERLKRYKDINKKVEAQLNYANYGEV